MNDRQAELQALLTRAATLEAQRQAACAARNVEAEQHAADNLRALWQRHSELEQQTRTTANVRPARDYLAIRARRM